MPSAPSSRSEQRLIEEARHAFLVQARVRTESAHVTRFGNPPERLRRGGGAVVVGVQLLASSALAGVDEEEWTRGDSWDEIGERGRRCRPAQDRDRCGLDGGLREREPAARTAQQVLANGAHTCALGDDSAELCTGGGCLE